MKFTASHNPKGLSKSKSTNQAGGELFKTSLLRMLTFFFSFFHALSNTEWN